LLLIRYDPDFNWQLCIPIYHPTATLVMAVYERDKCLGKLQYRISYLMALNHR
jgi:hypothetical protein